MFLAAGAVRALIARAPVAREWRRQPSIQGDPTAGHALEAPLAARWPAYVACADYVEALVPHDATLTTGSCVCWLSEAVRWTKRVDLSLA